MRDNGDIILAEDTVSPGSKRFRKQKKQIFGSSEMEPDRSEAMPRDSARMF